jgi:GT2 family glycosyltransferase
MKILIGITSKNRAKILPKAIESALMQNYANKEVWVYDDASTDETHLLAEKYPEVNWIFSKEPRGYVYARNMFMQKEGFDLFCSLDDDAWFLEPNAISEAAEVFEQDPLIGALGFDMVSPDYPELKEKRPRLLISNNFVGCGHIVNLKAAEKVHYYTVNPGFYGGEEKDLCIRLIDAGYKIVTFKGMYVWHDITAVGRSVAKQHQSGVCNDLVFFYRRTPLVFLVPVLAIQISKHLKSAPGEYRGEKLFKPAMLAMRDFFVWLVAKKTNRKPVSIKGYQRFFKLNKSGGPYALAKEIPQAS